MATSAYLIFGSDEYRVTAKAKEVIESLLPPDQQAMGLETINGAVDTVNAAITAIGRCIEAVSTGSLFGDRKVVWFRDISFLGDTVTGRSEDVKARLEELAGVIKAGLPPGQILVMTSSNTDKRFAFFKACKECCELHEFAVPEQGYKAEQQAEEVLNAILKESGLQMDEDAREVFLQKVGIDTRHIANEIQKLAIYIGKSRAVKIGDIEAVTSSSRESRAWDIADAFGKKDLGQALTVLRRLLYQEESPFLVMSVIQNRIRELMIFRQALDAGWLTVGDSGRGGAGAKWKEVPPEIEEVFTKQFEKDPRVIHPYRAGLLAAQAKKFSRQKLAQCQRAAIQAHEKMVSTNIPDEMTLELLLIQMLS